MKKFKVSNRDRTFIVTATDSVDACRKFSQRADANFVKERKDAAFEKFVITQEAKSCIVDASRAFNTVLDELDAAASEEWGRRQHELPRENAPESEYRKLDASVERIRKLINALKQAGKDLL